MKIAMVADFKEYYESHKNFKSVYDLGGRCLKITDVCMDFEPYFKDHNLVSVHPKHHAWSNDQSQDDLSCGGVSLSIC